MLRSLSFIRLTTRLAQTAVNLAGNTIVKPAQ